MKCLCSSKAVVIKGDKYWITDEFDWSNYIVLDEVSYNLLAMFCDMESVSIILHHAYLTHLKISSCSISWDGRTILESGYSFLGVNTIICIDDKCLFSLYTCECHTAFILVKRDSMEFLSSYSVWCKCVNSELFAQYIMRFKEIDFTL